ncbi:unnamed protein product [Brassica napus]|uniref:(rape) hypothetical protein n=1 Tax=Brassica napus TaxID=3708 RepID=A0A816MAV3_BRANA|nr:unnamed protein product [Brassica napus]
MLSWVYQSIYFQMVSILSGRLQGLCFIYLAHLLFGL